MGSNHDWQALCEVQIMPSGAVVERIEWCASPGCCACRYVSSHALPLALDRMFETLAAQLHRAHLLVAAGVVPVTRQ